MGLATDGRRCKATPLDLDDTTCNNADTCADDLLGKAPNFGSSGTDVAARDKPLTAVSA